MERYFKYDTAIRIDIAMSSKLRDGVVLDMVELRSCPSDISTDPRCEIRRSLKLGCDAGQSKIALP
jgi:hypothetical protein